MPVKTSGAPDKRKVVQKIKGGMEEGKFQYIKGYEKITPTGERVYVPPYVRKGTPTEEVTTVVMSPEERREYMNIILEAEAERLWGERLRSLAEEKREELNLRNILIKKTDPSYMTGFPPTGHPRFPMPVYRNSLFMREVEKNRGYNPWAYAEQALAEGFKFPSFFQRLPRSRRKSQPPNP